MALQDFLDPVLDERCHSIFDRGLQHVLGTRLLLDHAFHSVCTEKQFMESHPSFEAGSITRFAAFSSSQPKCIVLFDAELIPIVRPVPLAEFFVLFFRPDILFFAVLTDPTSQPLCQHAQHGVGETERVTAHIEQAGDGFYRTVGMQGAQDEMAGEGRFDTGVGCFFIPHFSYHDDVGVGTKKCPHGTREGESDLRLDLHLAQAILSNFHWIFRGPYLDVRGVDVPQDRVQCGGFSRAGRTDTQNDAVGFLRNFFKDSEITF